MWSTHIPQLSLQLHAVIPLLWRFLFAQEPPAAVLVPAGKGQLCSMGAKALNSFQKHLLDVEQSGGFIQVSDLSTNIYTADKPKTWSGRGTAACSAVPSTEGILSGL